MTDPNTSHHISQQYDIDLEQIRSRLAAMGALVGQQMEAAVDAFVNADRELARQVRAREPDVDQMETNIDSLCMRLLALRQPAARDLRLLLAVVHTINDLERIGDEANRLAKLALHFDKMGAPDYGAEHIRRLFTLTHDMLGNALLAFAGADSGKALEVARADTAVNDAYHQALDGTTQRMIQHADQVETLLNVIWALRSLERMGDHCRNIAEHTIQAAEGVDIRHTGMDNIASTVLGDRQGQD